MERIKAFWTKNGLKICRWMLKWSAFRMLLPCKYYYLFKTKNVHFFTIWLYLYFISTLYIINHEISNSVLWSQLIEQLNKIITFCVKQRQYTKPFLHYAFLTPRWTFMLQYYTECHQSDSQTFINLGAMKIEINIEMLNLTPRLYLTMNWLIVWL